MVKKQAEKGFKSSLQKQTFLKKVFNAASDDDIKDSLSDASKFFFNGFYYGCQKKVGTCNSGCNIDSGSKSAGLTTLVLIFPL